MNPEPNDDMTVQHEPFDLEMFRYTRIERPEDLPPRDELLVDVAILDMNHGVPNLGHDSLVHAIHESSRKARESADGSMSADLQVRVLSFDVRRSGVLPEWDPDRFRLFVGTGGPGHLDPRHNTGIEEWCEGIAETAGWELPLFQLFDRIRGDQRTALVGFCHSFGLICRWLDLAEPVLRSPAKGKSQGIVAYRLTDAATSHPWFSRFAEELVDAPHFRVLDSRLFDLVLREPAPPGITVLATEQESTEVVTMIEIERDPEGVMPRILGANHHPEVVDLHHMQEVLDEKLEKGEVTREWREERGTALSAFWKEADTDERMRRTSRYTLLEPLEFFIRKAMLARQEQEAATR